MDPQAHPLAALARRDLLDRYRTQGRSDLGLHPDGPPRHRHRPQGRRGGPPAQGRRALHEEAGGREGRGHEPGLQRGAARHGCRPPRAGRRRAARRARGVPAGDAPRRPDRDARRCARRARRVRGAPRGDRHGPQGVVPRGPGAVAHAPGEGGLRDGGREDDVRRDRREGVGLPRRRGAPPRAGERAGSGAGTRPCRARRAGGEAGCHARQGAGQGRARCRGTRRRSTRRGTVLDASRVRSRTGLREPGGDGRCRDGRCT